MGRKGQRQRLAKGIYLDGSGVAIIARDKDGKQRERRFAPDIPLERLIAIRDEMRAEGRPQRLERLAYAVGPFSACFLYFISDGEFIKIGRTEADVQARLSSMQTGNARSFKVLAQADTVGLAERQVHRRFAHLRASGEWFRPGPDLMAFIERVRAGEPLNDLLQSEP